jgi:hypothetical protein
MIKEEKASINAQLMLIAGRVSDLANETSQDEVYAIVEELQAVYDKIFNL